MYWYVVYNQLKTIADSACCPHNFKASLHFFNEYYQCNMWILFLFLIWGKNFPVTSALISSAVSLSRTGQQDCPMGILP